jgi:hypothetical protein
MRDGRVADDSQTGYRQKFRGLSGKAYPSGTLGLILLIVIILVLLGYL